MKAGGKTSKAHRGKMVPPVVTSNHPYPSSIAIQVGSPTSDKEEVRSPKASPTERGKSKSRRHSSNHESRQQSSPYRKNSNGSGNTDANNGATFEMTSHLEDGRKHFLQNELSEAVDAYSRAIRTGLEELKHRKGMVHRITSPDRYRRRGESDQPDAMTILLGGSIASAHLDMGKALEVAGKYSEALEEYENGIGMLEHTCHKSKKDPQLKMATREIQRMERAVAVSGERKKLQSSMDAAMAKLDSCSGVGEKDAARKQAIACARRLTRTERDSLGEQSYAVARLKLKIAKLQCEGGNMEGGLDDAEEAIMTLKSVLGEKHSLLGASCIFSATVYEKRISLATSTPVTCPKPLKQLTSYCKSMMNRALELYADALEPLTFKYSYRSAEENEVQPEIGDIFHRIGRIYSKKGSHSSAVDAYRRAFEAYGVPWNAIKSGTINRTDFHPNAAIIWYELAELHFATNEYGDSIHACEKTMELILMVRSLGKSTSNDSIETLPILTCQVAAASYTALHRHPDSTRSYQKALSELKKARSSLSSSDRGKWLGTNEESKILRKIGRSLLREVKVEEAKIYFVDALRVLRSSADNEKCAELPGILLDIGDVHLRLEEFHDALKVLGSCIKLYADQGVPEYDSNVERARQLFDDAQCSLSNGLNKSTEKSHHPIRVLSAGSPTSDVSLLQTPAGTLPTTSTAMCSTLSSNRHISCNETVSKSGKKQLQSLLDELTEESPADEMKTDTSTSHNPVPSGKIMHQEEEIVKLTTSLKLLSAELRDSKIELARLKESHQNEISANVADLSDSCKQQSVQEITKLKDSHARELQSLQTKLDDANAAANRLQIRLKETEKERDEAKKERVFATTNHRKEVETFLNREKLAANMNAKYKCEIESLKKELQISETSYQEILQVIDDEKDQLRQVYDSQMTELKKDLEALQEQSKEASKYEGSLKDLENTANSLKEENVSLSEKISSLKSNNQTLRSEKEAAGKEVASLNEIIDEQREKIEKLENPDKADIEDKAKRLLSERSAAKNNSDSSGGYLEKLKRLELELEAEKSRRMSLESSYQEARRVYGDDRRRNYDHRFLGWHQQEIADMKELYNEAIIELSDIKRQRDQAKHDFEKRIHALEIEVRTERSNNVELENMIRELTESIDRSKGERARLIESHKQEISNYLGVLEEKKEDLDDLNRIMKENAEKFQRVMEDCDEQKKARAIVEEQLLDKSTKLKDAMDDLDAERMKLKKITEDKESLEKTLVDEKAGREAANHDIDCLKDKLESLNDSYESLKKDYLEATAVFESEMREVRKEADDHLQFTVAKSEQQLRCAEEEVFRLRNEMDQTRHAKIEAEENYQQSVHEIKYEHAKELSRKEEELEGAKIRIKNLFSELNETREQLTMVTHNLKTMIESRNDELNQSSNECERQAEEITRLMSKLVASEDEIKSKIDALSKLETYVAETEEKCAEYEDKLKEAVSNNEMQRNDMEHVLDELCAKLSHAEEEIKELRMECDTLKEADAESKTKCQENLEKCCSILQQLFRQLDGLFPETDDDLDLVEGSIMAGQSYSTEALESMSSQIFSVMNVFHKRTKRLRSELKMKDDEIESAKGNASNILHQLDVLESKHATLKDELRAKEHLQNEHVELLDKYEKLQLRNAKLEEDIRGLSSKQDEQLVEAEEKRDLYQSRLRDAVDDLEELELERDELRDEVEKAYQACSQLEKKLLTRIEVLETENERLQGNDGHNLESDAILFEKENKIKSLEQRLQAANSELESLRHAVALNKQTNDDNFYPDILPRDNSHELDQLRAKVIALEQQKTELCNALAESQLDSFTSAQPRHDIDVAITALQKDFQQSFDARDAEYKAEVAVLESHLKEMIKKNENLTQELCFKSEESRRNRDDNGDSRPGIDFTDSDSSISSHYDTPVVAASESKPLLDEFNKLKGKLLALEQVNVELSSQLAQYRDEEIEKARAYDEIRDMVDSLKRSLSSKNELNDALHAELAVWKTKLEMLESAEKGKSDNSNKAAQNIAFETNSTESETSKEEIEMIKDQVRGLEKSNKELTSQLAESRVHTLAAARTHDHDQKTITALREVISETDEILKTNLSCAQQTKDKIQQTETQNAELRREIAELNKHGNETISSLQSQLTNVLNDKEDDEARRRREISTLNEEYQTAMKSLNELQQENEVLKSRVHTLMATKPNDDENAYYEKEISNAHSRFVSMENSLQERISRLEKEKVALIEAHESEIEQLQSLLNQTRVELSAWKLEMQNALNDSEAMMKERDELKAQIQVYRSSLEAVHVAKAETEERLHVLNQSIH